MKKVKVIEIKGILKTAIKTVFSSQLFALILFLVIYNLLHFMFSKSINDMMLIAVSGMISWFFLTLMLILTVKNDLEQVQLELIEAINKCEV